MTRQNAPTCEDCYFRRHGLCAMTPERPCPTFRAATRTLQPPRQPRLPPPPAPRPAGAARGAVRLVGAEQTGEAGPPAVAAARGDRARRALCDPLHRPE